MSSLSPRDSRHPVEDDRVSEAEERPWLFALEIPPLIERGLRAFLCDLPELLRKYEGQWVAYSGDRRLGISRSKSELTQQCLRRGLRRDEFVVRGIGPEGSDEIDPAEFLNI
jgi:hypothetical protein